MIAYVNRAGVYMNQHRTADALADYQHAIDIDPTLARAYLGRARASRTVEDWTKLFKISTLPQAWTP